MTKRTGKVYLDEDVNTVVAAMLSAENIVAQTVSGLGRKSLPDDQQLEFAVANESLIVTHNRVDFEQLAVEYFNESKIHHGIIIATFKSPRAIADELIEILNRYSSEEFINQIIYI
ncbi:MAG: DUF5615 family PIN-like protein [Pyrinomonadaceae bacterium]